MFTHVANMLSGSALLQYIESMKAILLHTNRGAEEDSEVKIILRCNVFSATHSFDSKITFEMSFSPLLQFDGSIDCY